jgi:hypothetical protein
MLIDPAKQPVSLLYRVPDFLTLGLSKSKVSSGQPSSFAFVWRGGFGAAAGRSNLAPA